MSQCLSGDPQGRGIGYQNPYVPHVTVLLCLHSGALWKLHNSLSKRRVSIAQYVHDANGLCHLTCQTGLSTDRSLASSVVEATGGKLIRLWLQCGHKPHGKVLLQPLELSNTVGVCLAPRGYRSVEPLQLEDRLPQQVGQVVLVSLSVLLHEGNVLPQLTVLLRE